MLLWVIQKEKCTFFLGRECQACLLSFRMTLSLAHGRSLNYIPQCPPNAIITIINGTWHKPLPHVTLSHNQGVMALLWCNAGGFLVSVSGSQILRVPYFSCRLNASAAQGASHTSNKIQFHLWVWGCLLNAPICNLFQTHWLYQYYLDTDWKGAAVRGAEIHLWVYCGQYLCGACFVDCKSLLIICKLCSRPNIKFLFIHEVKFIIKTKS